MTIVPTMMTLLCAVALAAGCGDEQTGSSTKTVTVTAGQSGPTTTADDSGGGGGGNDDSSDMTASQKQAIQSAESYLDSSGGFSKARLIRQLSAKSADGFSKTDAIFAVNHINADWKQEAIESAKSYVQLGFSRASLIKQLESKVGSSTQGEGFTHAQALYAVNNVGL